MKLCIAANRSPHERIFHRFSFMFWVLYVTIALLMKLLMKIYAIFEKEVNNGESKMEWGVIGGDREL